jgi:hypothetical protein
VTDSDEEFDGHLEISASPSNQRSSSLVVAGILVKLASFIYLVGAIVDTYNQTRIVKFGIYGSRGCGSSLDCSIDVNHVWFAGAAETVAITFLIFSFGMLLQFLGAGKLRVSHQSKV